MEGTGYSRWKGAKTNTRGQSKLVSVFIGKGPVHEGCEPIHCKFYRAYLGPSFTNNLLEALSYATFLVSISASLFMQ